LQFLAAQHGNYQVLGEEGVSSPWTSGRFRFLLAAHFLLRHPLQQKILLGLLLGLGFHNDRAGKSLILWRIDHNAGGQLGIGGVPRGSGELQDYVVGLLQLLRLQQAPSADATPVECPSQGRRIRLQEVGVSDVVEQEMTRQIANGHQLGGRQSGAQGADHIAFGQAMASTHVLDQPLGRVAEFSAIRTGEAIGQVHHFRHFAVEKQTRLRIIRVRD